MRRASAAHSSVAPAARQPRREALLRSGVALATAVMLIAARCGISLAEAELVLSLARRSEGAA